MSLNKICSLGSRLGVLSAIVKNCTSTPNCVVNGVFAQLVRYYASKKTAAKPTSPRVLVVAFGNPVVDSVVKLKDRNVIQKFNLQEDGHKQTDPAFMQDLIKEVRKQQYHWTNVAGGSALNTMRILQWLYDKQSSTVIFGAVGVDPNATLLKTLVERFKVQTKFAFVERSTTGWVVSLVHKSTRSLVASIGAAEKYSVKHFDQPSNLLLLNDANLIYMEGFFITKRKPISRYILELGMAKGKPFAFNISAEYLLHDYKDEMLHFIDSCSILFGNQTEYNLVAKIMNVSVEDLIKKLIASKNYKLIVITNGPEPTHAYFSNQDIKYDVPIMKPEEIIDTTGCGDSFAAGFLYGYLHNLEPLQCMKWGCWMAQHVIRQIGCTPPPDLKPTEIHTIK